MSDWVDEAIVDGNRRILREDALLLIRACEATRAKAILEIGSMEGCSTIVLGKWAQENGGHLYAIEPRVKGRLRENLAKWGLRNAVTVIPQASPWVTEPLPELDVLFIDGCHLTRWALVDYHYWIPRVRLGGIVVFHDWCGGKGVNRQIQRAVEIVLESDGPQGDETSDMAKIVRSQRMPEGWHLEEFGRVEAKDRGSIAFQKIKDIA